MPELCDETAAVIDKMLRPNPDERQKSYKELIVELEAAHAAVVAREAELRARWSWPVRAVVSLGMLAGIGALIFGIVFGLRHLPKHRVEPALAAEPTQTSATPVVNLKAQLEPARRELQAGHYATAEALFREIAASTPAVQPAAELCAGLQLWERGSFAQAATALQHFTEVKPLPPFAWLNEFKPLARARLDDYQLYLEWQKARDTSKDPEVMLRRIQAVSGKLKARGALVFQLADEEAKIAAQVAAESQKHAAEEKKAAAEEAPRWQAALVAERKLLTAYQFENAVASLEKLKLTSAALQAERDAERQRVGWLADWKTKLISDINSTGYGGAVTDIHGMKYDGPVRRATTDKFELKTRYGSVMTGWLNLSPEMLLKMSTAFIRPAAPDIVERQWLCAIFAAQTGQAGATLRKRRPRRKGVFATCCRAIFLRPKNSWRMLCFSKRHALAFIASGRGAAGRRRRGGPRSNFE
jgi:hypothetical protein